MARLLIASASVRRRRAAAFIVCALSASAGWAVPGAVARGAVGDVPAPAPIPLPDRSQLGAVVNPTALLGPDRPDEILNRSPGPIDDTEHVVVGLAADGSPATVRVDQRLVINGIGDFSLKIPGPALDVRAPPEASNRPGLRRGSVVWEGFAGGRKELEAQVELRPDIEQLRLPLAVTVTPTEVRIENRTAVPVPVADGEPQPGAAERVLAAVRSSLEAGVPPAAGAAAIPPAIPSASPPVTTAQIQVAAPFRVRGEVASAAGPVPFDAVVPGAKAPDGVLVVPASGPVRFTAEPALPDPALLGGATGRDALRAVEVALWSTLRREDVSAYLGNPRPGTSSTSFSYEPAASPPAAAAVSVRDEPKPLAIALAVALAVAALAGAAIAWSRN